LAYLRDAPQAEVHVFQAGHFASAEVPDPIARLVLDFTARHRGLELEASPAAH